MNSRLSIYFYMLLLLSQNILWDTKVLVKIVKARDVWVRRIYQKSINFLQLFKTEVSVKKILSVIIMMVCIVTTTIASGLSSNAPIQKNQITADLPAIDTSPTIAVGLTDLLALPDTYNQSFSKANLTHPMNNASTNIAQTDMVKTHGNGALAEQDKNGAAEKKTKLAEQQSDMSPQIVSSTANLEKNYSPNISANGANLKSTAKSEQLMNQANISLPDIAKASFPKNNGRNNYLIVENVV